MEKENSRTSFILSLFLSGILMVAFLLFTGAVMVLDVEPVGFEGSPIGFSSLNTWFHGVFPSDHELFQLSEYIGYFALGLAAVNGFGALLDLIRSRGFAKMKRRNLIVCFYYAVVVAFYVLFEFFTVNLRPIEAEASYPSSHTLLALTVLYSEILLFRYCAKDRRFLARIFSVCMVLIMIVMVFSRLLSGVHWLTDIVGGVILSLSLMMMLRAFIYRFDPPKGY